MGVIDSASDTAADVVGEAKDIWAKYKYYIIAGLVAFFIILIMICCCICKRSMKKKKKKEQKLKLKGAKPKTKMKRIQPTKPEKRVMEELGTIKFLAKYDHVGEALLVTVVEAEDVPVRDLSGYAYSYVVAKILPLYDDSTTVYKTQFVRAGFWPTFGDVLVIPVPAEQIKNQILYLYLYEMNRWTKQDGIGQYAIELDDLNLQSEKEQIMKRKLKPYDPLIGLEVETGALFVYLEYNNEEWELQVEVMQADIIPQDEDKEKESAYVTVSIMNKDDDVLEKQKTHVVKGSLQPSYDDKLIFRSIPDNLLPDMKMKLTLKASRLLKKNYVIGSTIIKPTHDQWRFLVENGATKGWFSVYRKPRKDKD